VSASRAAGMVHGKGGEVWAAAAGGTPCDQWRATRPLLLMLGAEGGGLSDDALSFADGTVSIILSRDVESLNVAVAAGVVLARAGFCDRESLFSSDTTT